MAKTWLSLGFLAICVSVCAAAQIRNVLESARPTRASTSSVTATM